MLRVLMAAAISCCVFLPTVRSEEPSVESLSAKTIGELTALLGSSDTAERVEAIDALATRGEGAAEAVPALLEQLEFDNPYVRAASARALGAIGAEPGKAIPALIEHFSDKGAIEEFDLSYRVTPLFAIYGTSAAKFGEEALDPLIEALGSDSAQVSLAAAVGLEAMGEPSVKAMPLLIKMLESDDTRRRNSAAGVIRGIGPAAAEAVPALVKLLDAESFHTQYWTCRALGAIGPASVVATDDLVGLLTEGTVSVRRNAAMTLGNIGPEIGPEAVDKLIRVIDEEFTAPVREEAVVALGKLKPFAKESVPALRKALTDPDYPLPTHTARSLWLLTDDPKEALPTLIKAMDDLSYFQHAVEVLAEMGPQAAPAVDRLIEALDEPDPDDRASAAYALARIGAPAGKAKEPLRKLLEAEEEQVREAGKKALEVLSEAE